jgi:predicted nuclease of predicted toxin-antitoxin system
VKILFDHNVPAFLKQVLPHAQTAYEQGWQTLSNGDLLSAAEDAGFELLVTLDRGFATEHNMLGRTISIAIIRPKSQARTAMLDVTAELATQVKMIAPGSVTFWPTTDKNG